MDNKEAIKVLSDTLRSGILENLEIEGLSVAVEIALHALHTREEIKRKQSIGIKKALESGKYRNRITKRAYKASNFPLFSRYYKEWKAKLITKTEFAQLLGVSRPTLDKLIKQVG